MSKAVITLEYADGKLELGCDFYPTVKTTMSYDDHPAAFEALSMIESIKHRRSSVFVDDEEVDDFLEGEYYDE